MLFLFGGGVVMRVVRLYDIGWNIRRGCDVNQMRFLPHIITLPHSSLPPFLSFFSTQQEGEIADSIERPSSALQRDTPPGVLYRTYLLTHTSYRSRYSTIHNPPLSVPLANHPIPPGCA